MSKVNAGQASSTLIPKYIGSDFDKVVAVADNIEQVVIVSDSIEDVGTVADNINYVKEVAEDLHGMPVTMYTGENPPVLNPMPEGVMWYCTTDGRTYVWYTDADSGQWVESAPQSAMKDEATNIFFHSTPSNVNPAYRNATLYSTPAPEAEISVTHNALNTPVVQAQFIREEALWVDVSVIGAQGIVTLMGYSSGNSQLKAEIITWKNGAEGTSLGASQWVTLPSQPSVVSLPVTLANIDVLDAGDSYVVKLTSQMNAGGSAVSTILVDGNTSSRFGIIFNTSLIGLNDGIRDGVITSAPTENAVYDALQLKVGKSQLVQSGNLTSTANWANVPAYSDSELGGSDGPLNAQAKALTARSELLLTDVREALRRSYAEAGYNLVKGSFEAGGTLVNANDVLLQESTGKAYTGPAGDVPAGTDPVDVKWTPRSNVALRSELSAQQGATLVKTSDGRTVEQRLAALPNEVDASGTAAMLVSAHNQDASAHPQLSAFITAEADRAKRAADAASLSGDVYPDTASGLASTTNGKYFSVVSTVAEGYLDLYRNNAGLAAFQKTYPSSALVERLDNGFNKLTGNSGFSVDGSDDQSFIEVKNEDAKALVVGTHSTEMMVFDTISKKVNVPASDLSDATVSKVIHLSDSEEMESENTEDLITSTSAKTIGSGKHSLTFDTVNGELISTFKIVDKSQNGGVIFDTDVPDIIAGVPPGYELATRVYQAIPTIARTGSRFWLSWRADDQNGEFPDNYFVIGYSDDNCKTVTESHILKFSNAQHQLVDQMLWTNQETGELWLFWGSHGKGVHTDGVGGCWCSVLENPEAPRGFSWSTPYKYRNVGNPRVPVRVAGRWMQCIDLWDAGVQSLYPNETGCTFVEFDPRTKSTVNIGHNTPNRGTRYSGFFESELIQLTNGRLMSLTRSYNSSVETTRSFSIDGGKTWSAQETYTALGETTSSRMWMGRTPAGRLMVVYNNLKSRKNMVVKLSEDDGETFPYSVVLEGPASPQNTSYPIATFDGDDIYVTYDYGRQVANEIRVTIVKETEIVAGTSVPDINIVSGPTIA